MTIVGIGLDVCSIDRMRKAIERHGERFVNRICSPRELEEAAARDLVTFVASRFAVKEAFAKALDGAPGVGWHEVEVKKAPSGKPSLELHGNAILATTRAGADKWHVTITHDAGVAAAMVVLESKP